jgi:NIPSNAP
LPAQHACPFIELRQYTLVPGTRDAFVELFEREFIETQEACGMRLLGIFNDQGDPDRFVWLRGFADMGTRRQSLIDFYTGPCWRAHGAAANAMMVDSDNVHLLQPVPGFPSLGERTAVGSPDAGGRLTVAVQPVGEAIEPHTHTLHSGADLLAVMQTADVVNDFPQLPVIEDESVIVLVLAGDDRTDDDVATLARTTASSIGRSVSAAPDIRHLGPTRRSALR